MAMGLGWDGDGDGEGNGEGDKVGSGRAQLRGEASRLEWVRGKGRGERGEGLATVDSVPTRPLQAQPHPGRAPPTCLHLEKGQCGLLGAPPKVALGSIRKRSLKSFRTVRGLRNGGV